VTHPDAPDVPATPEPAPHFPAAAPAPGDGLASETADRTDRLILEVASHEGAWGSEDAAVLVVADRTGALTEAALARGTGPVLAFHTSGLAVEAAARAHAPALAEGRLLLPHRGDAAREPAGLEDFVRSTGIALATALVRLPKSLRSLEATARAVARTGTPDLVLVGGGAVKHMSRTQNDVLGGAFAQVHATRGSGSSRCLVAARPRPDTAPATAEHGSAEVHVHGATGTLALRGIGGVFGGGRADAGSLLLLRALDAALEEDAALKEHAPAVHDAPLRALDLGSGNGLLTAYLARALPDAVIVGSDDDLDAVASTRATLAASGLERPGIDVRWEASLASQRDGSADLIVLNPPFHDGTAVDATLVQGLLDAAARVLRPGGALWFVHNSHLRYRPEVERRVGPVQQRARDRRFTVLRAVRRSA